MILRIRYNLGNFKVVIDDNSTIAHLKETIIQKLSITNKRIDLVLNKNESQIFLQDKEIIRELGLKNGEELLMKGDFEKVIIEKSYVNSNGEMINKGVYINCPETNKQEDIEDTLEPALDDKNFTQNFEKDNLKSSHEKNECEAEKVLFKQDFEEVRPPDDTKKSTLIENHPQLTDENSKKLANYKSFLETSGINDEIILSETQNFINELLSMQLIESNTQKIDFIEDSISKLTDNFDWPMDHKLHPTENSSLSARNLSGIQRNPIAIIKSEQPSSNDYQSKRQINSLQAKKTSADSHKTRTKTIGPIVNQKYKSKNPSLANSIISQQTNKSFRNSKAQVAGNVQPDRKMNYNKKPPIPMSRLASSFDEDSLAIAIQMSLEERDHQKEDYSNRNDNNHQAQSLAEQLRLHLRDDNLPTQEVLSSNEKYVEDSLLEHSKRISLENHTDAETEHSTNRTNLQGQPQMSTSDCYFDEDDEALALAIHESLNFS